MQVHSRREVKRRVAKSLWVISCAVVAQAGPIALARGQAAASDSAEARPAVQAPEEVGRVLADQGAIVVLKGPRGKVKAKVEEGAKRFRLPMGESPAILFKLPDFTGPYSLKLASFPSGVFNPAVFVPGGVFLDADFRQTRPFEEDEVKTNQKGFKKGFHLSALLPVGEENKIDRYLLVYTRGDLVGQTADRMSISGMGGVLFGGGRGVARSAKAKLVIEVAPKKAK
jgi:Maltose operon periplasmic protein precursor (MalM)